jgi:hypothetical protein
MTTIVNPKKLAIFYGWPSAVNGAGGNVNLAVAVFKDYKVVVFGAGLEDDSHPDHANTASIITHPDMSGCQSYGYIDATQALDVIQTKIDKWYAMGVKGIFMDQFGYDFGLTRQKQREIIWCIHEKASGLRAFVNAWNVDDVFGSAVHPVNNPTGLSCVMGANDVYLAESFAIMNGAYDDSDVDSNNVKDFQDKATKMKNYRTTYGTKMAAITTNDASAFDQNKANYSYYIALANELDYWGWGEQYFSAASAQLPYRNRPNYQGTKFTATLIVNPTTGVIERDTNVGVHIDTIAHTTSTLMD